VSVSRPFHRADAATENALYAIGTDKRCHRHVRQISRVLVQPVKYKCILSDERALVPTSIEETEWKGPANDRGDSGRGTPMPQWPSQKNSVRTARIALLCRRPIVIAQQTRRQPTRSSRTTACIIDTISNNTHYLQYRSSDCKPIWHLQICTQVIGPQFSFDC